MNKTLIKFIIGLFFFSSSLSAQDFNIDKKYIPNGKFYFGINPTGQKDDLQSIFDFLMLANQEKIYSNDKRYEAQYGCKPRDCDNKGMIWIDNKNKTSIGVIRHTFWEKLDFSKSKENQIFIFTNSFKKIDELPKEFKSAYDQWLKAKKISPSLIRFYNSRKEISNINKF